MSDQEAPTGQTTEDSHNAVAADIFSDISNPDVEKAVESPPATSSTTEPVIPSVTDFKTPKEEPPVEVNTPVTPAATPATPAAPVQYTPEQLVAFEQWKAAQQQQIIPPAATPQQQAAQPQQPTQQRAQPTQAEIDKQINRYTVSPEKFQQMFSEEDPAKAAGVLNEMMQGAVTQAVTMAYHLIQDQGNKLQQTVQPYMQFADNQREVMLREQFYQSNPDLRGQEMLISAVQTQIVAERQSGQYQPVSEAQVLTDVATRTKALIAQWQQNGQHPQAQPNGSVPVSQPHSQVKPPMAALPTTAGGGLAPSAAASKNLPGQNSVAVSLFG